MPNANLSYAGDAFNLLLEHIPELRPSLKRVWHFGAIRWGKLAEFQTSLREAVGGA